MRDMHISGTLPPLPAVLLTRAPAAAGEAWKVGQILQATAVSTTPSGQATLDINGTLLLAQTPLPLKPGQTLQLEVTRLAELALLRVILPDAKPRQPAITLSLPAPATPPSPWQAGQIIKALVVEMPHPRQTVLSIAGQEFAVKTQLPVQAGQTLKLEILQPGVPAALRLLPSATPAQTASLAVRDALPRQTPLPALLANLAVVAQATPKSGPPLPAPVVALARQVLARLPTPESLAKPEGLQQALAQSGLFLEHKLAQPLQTAQPLPPVSADFKGGLLGLLAALFSLVKGTPPPPPAPGQGTPPALPQAPQPPAPFTATPQAQARAQPTVTPQLGPQQALLELFRHVEGGLARVQLHQLISTATDDDGRRLWLMELPVRQGEQTDVIALRIERDKGGSDKRQAAPWSVNLALNLENLGPLNVRVTLAGGAVSASFWAQQPATAELFRRHLHELQGRLTKVGLKVGNLTAHKGAPPAPDTGNRPWPYALLDVDA
jgi:hypothetical protein